MDSKVLHLIDIIGRIRLGNLLERIDTSIVSCDYPHLAALAANRQKVSRARDARGRVVVEQHYAPTVPDCRLDLLAELRRRDHGAADGRVNAARDCLAR